MRKDDRLTFRVSAELKQQMQAIAQREGQSVARICEAFLIAGSDAYRRVGSKSLQKYIGRTLTSFHP
jgi:hypothetical protein